MPKFNYTIRKTVVSLKSLFMSAPDEIQYYFEHLPSLLDSFPLDVALAYLFYRVELAQHMTLYCGVVKIHRVDSELARIAVENQHHTRDGFKELFKTIYGQNVNKDAQAYLKEAEDVRDRVMHGKTVPEQEKRVAICRVLHYAVKMNEQTYRVAKFRVFGKLQGFKGRLRPLDKSTSRWILKGVGLSAC